MGNKFWSCAELLEWIRRRFHPGATERPNRFAPLLQELRLAQKEWGYANQYFNLVSDPDLVDLAIYYMGQTEKKYLYLLKKARESGVSVEQYSCR